MLQNANLTKIPDGLVGLTNYTNIDLSNNQIKKLSLLPTSSKENKTIKINSNPIETVDVPSVPPNVEKINLTDTNIEGQQVIDMLSPNMKGFIMYIENTDLGITTRADYYKFVEGIYGKMGVSTLPDRNNCTIYTSIDTSEFTDNNSPPLNRKELEQVVIME